MTKNEFTLVRDCTATVIPFGNEQVLPAGARVFVTQTLGGTVTVRTDEGLFRLARENLDALGEGFSLDEPGRDVQDEAFSEQSVWEVLKSCYDPEIPINIVDLGLVYTLAIEQLPSGRYEVGVKMTLTAQGCGMGPVIAQDAREKIEALPDVEKAEVQIVWEPVWTPQMISSEGRRILGLE